MPDFHVTLKDGTKRDFLEKGRPGGSWTNSLRYEPGFVVFRDEWGGETAIPAELILEIRKDAGRGGW
jgi:hypothetical protein